MNKLIGDNTDQCPNGQSDFKRGEISQSFTGKREHHRTGDSNQLNEQDSTDQLAVCKTHNYLPVFINTLDFFCPE